MKKAHPQWPTHARGLLVWIGRQGPYAHKVGGAATCEDNICPNCKVPFMRVASLDTRDPQLRSFGLPGNHFELLTCMRCVLNFERLTYRILEGNRIELLRYLVDPSGIENRDWAEVTGTAEFYKEMPFDLVSMPDELQEIILRDLQNAPKSMDRERMQTLLGDFKIQDSSLINQIGGRPIYIDLHDQPVCPYCTKHFEADSSERIPEEDRRYMLPLAAFTNDPERNFLVTYKGRQIVFFWCKRCHVISTRTY